MDRLVLVKYPYYSFIKLFTAIGSNTHNNGNPAGDGQAGDAGEGTRGEQLVLAIINKYSLVFNQGTDRHNIVQIPDPNSNYPTPFEETNMWDDIDVLWSSYNDPGSEGDENVALAFASAGYYHCRTGCTERTTDPGAKTELNNLLNNAPASFEGALVRFQRGIYHYICSRNNNFTNRSQKGTITVRSV